MKKLIYISIVAFLAIGCGGGGSGGAKVQVMQPIDTGRGIIKSLRVKSNDQRTIIAWKEIETNPNSNSSDSYLFVADKLNGKWTIPTKDDYLRKGKGDDTPNSLDLAINNNEAIIVSSNIDYDKSNNKYTGALMMSQYKDGEWKPFNSISPYGSISMFPKIAMNQNNNAIVVWRSGLNQGAMYIANYENGKWSIPSGINDYKGAINAGNKVDYPMNISYKNNNAFLTWKQKESKTSNTMKIYSASYSSPLWMFPQNSKSKNGNENVDMSNFKSDTDDLGNKIIVMQVFDTAKQVMHIKSATYCNNSWHLPTSSSHIDTSTSLDKYNTLDLYLDTLDVKLNGNGFGIVAWMQYNSDKNVIYANEYDAPSCIMTMSDKNNPISFPDTNALILKVAVNDNGNAIIAWLQEDNKKNRLYFATYKDDAWQRPKKGNYISTKDGDVSGIDVALNNNNIATIVWIEETGQGNSKLYKKEINIKE